MRSRQGVALAAAVLALGVGEGAAARANGGQYVLATVGRDGTTRVLSTPFEGVARGTTDTWTLSADGRRIAFIGPVEIEPSRDRPGSWALEIGDLATGAVRRVGAVPGPADQFATLGFSPDGTRLSTDSIIESKSAFDGEVHLLDLRSGARRFVDDAETPVWSPGGQRLAYTSGVHYEDPPGPHETPRVVVAAADGTRARPVGVGATPRWSPDGRRVVYYACGGICVAGDGHARRIVPFGSLPDWAPRGNVIAFTRQLRGRCELWLVRPDGSRRRRLVRSMGPPRCPGSLRFSPDGRTIATVAGGDSQDRAVRFYRLDGSVTRVPGRAQTIDRWLPDASGVAVNAWR